MVTYPQPHITAPPIYPTFSGACTCDGGEWAVVVVLAMVIAFGVWVIWFLEKNTR